MPANNYSLNFSGSQWADLPVATTSGASIAGLAVFTWEAWVKPRLDENQDSSAIYKYLWGERQGWNWSVNGTPRGDNYRFAVACTKQSVRFGLCRSDTGSMTWYSYPFDFDDDRWHHIAFVARVTDGDPNNRKYSIFIDGALMTTSYLNEQGHPTLKIGEYYDANNDVAAATSAKFIRLGFTRTESDANSISPRYWQGQVDVIRIWRTGREQNAISQAKGDLLTNPANESDLVEEWTLEQYGQSGTNLNKFQGPKTSGIGTCYSTYNSALEVSGTSTPYSGTGTPTLWNTDRPLIGNDSNDVVVPSTPATATTSNITSSGFTMTWSGSTDNVYVQGYQIQISTLSNFSTLVTGYNPLILGNAVRSNTPSDLSPSTTYYWRVRAFDAAGNTSGWTQPSPAATTTTTTADTTPPSAPVASSATNLATYSFSANWSASTDTGGIQGYRLDVATDEFFSNYVPGYASRVVGNVLTFTVNENISPNTAYYYRVRAVDNSANESLPSNTITLQTVALPDTTPPNPVSLLNPSSVERTRFVANWEEGVDNVGVTGYYLDVSTSFNFDTLVTGTTINVGNVTSYSVTSLTPGQQYYYRVRAYDLAGNVSTDSGSYIMVTTDQPQQGTQPPYTIYNTNPLSAEIREANPTTSYSPSTFQVQGTSGSQRKALLLFDWTNSIPQGSVINAVLKLYTTNTSAASFKIARTTTTTWGASVTWNTAPAIDATTLTLAPTANNTFTSIDVSSLLVSGSTKLGLMIYWNATNQTDDWQFDSSSGTLGVSLALSVDPQTAFETDAASLTEVEYERRNLLLNPNMEGSLTNTITAQNSGSVTSNTAQFYRGTKSVQVTPAVGTSNYSGARVLSVAGIGGTTARYFAASFYVKGSVTSSANSHFLTIRYVYSDATTSSGGGIAWNTTTQWQLISITGTTPTTVGKTLDYIYLEIGENSGTGNVFYIDAAILRLVSASGDSVGGYFDGDTRNGGAWASSTDASYSTFSAPSLTYAGSYVGDSDANATATLKMRYSNAIEILPSSALTLTRASKSFEMTSIGNTLHNVFNLVENPSFESGIDLWTITGTGSASTTYAYAGSQSLKVAVTGSAQGCSYGSTRLIKAAVGGVIRLSAALRVPTGMSLTISIQAYTSAGATAGSASTLAVTGNDAWAVKTLTHTCPASTASVIISFLTSTSSSGAFYVDAVQVVKGTFDYPYTDGDTIGGRWTGIPHLSHSWKTLEYNTEYQSLMTITDAGGVFGDNPYIVQYTTSVEPTTSLTTQTLQLDVSDDQIVVVAPYLGDDNETSIAIIEYKRGDQSVWNRATTIYDRVGKTASALIAYLTPGTEYDVRVTFVDAVVYNTNPQTAQVFTTTTSTALPVVPVVSFGGFVLQGPDDHPYWVTSHDSFSHPSRRVQVETLPRLDGGIEIQSLWGTRTIQLRGGVSGSTRAELSDNLAALRKAFALPKQRLVIDTLSDTNRYFTATCTNFGVQEVGGQNIRHVLWDAEFIAADPFRYESGATAIDNISLDNNDTLIIQNDGDLFSEPIFTITTTSSLNVSVQLMNLTTGERIIPTTTFSIVNNDVMVIDTTKLSITKNAYEMDYSGSFIRLVPGENVLKVTISPISESITLSANYQQRYL